MMKSRYAHKAAAFSLGSRVMEVILFGGRPSRPYTVYSDAEFPQMDEDSLTAVLRFGESIIQVNTSGSEITCINIKGD